MSPQKTCPDCGIDLPPDAPAGVCPKCLLEAGIHDPSAKPADDPTLNSDLMAPESPAIPPTQHSGTPSTSAPQIGATIKYFGDYELLGEIARGGMGVVYRARQVRLNRVVALKMILAGQFAGQADIQRFQTEAEAAAQLDHPGIVPIFEVGEHEGHHFFSMGLVEGESLAARISDGPLAPKEAAELVRKISEAVEYAHEKGVVHRDLKPANILIDQDGQPRVTDFGLAKQVQGDSNLTGTGQILGTPSYMPPEQAAGRVSDVRETADVYALGAILYATLTGRPPFQADNPLDTLLQVLEREPAPPSTLNPKVPLDLETICFKCLEKDRRRRYASAQALADELQRFLNGEPIHARPISRPARTWRWCKRKPLAAALLATAAVLLITLGVGGWLVASREIANASAQSALRKRADEQQRKARDSEQLARRNLKIAEQNAYDSDMILVQRDWQDANIGHLTGLLDRHRDREDLKGFEWGYWNRLAHSDLLTLRKHTGWIQSVSFSPDGMRLASAGHDGRVRVWDLATRQVTLTLKVDSTSSSSVAFSPDGTRLAAQSSQTVRVWDSATGKRLITLIGNTDEGRHEFVNGVVFSPDGTRLAAGTREKVRVWDAASGEPTLVLKGHTDQVRSVAFNTDGTRLASAGLDMTVRLWDASTGQEMLTFNGHTGNVLDVSFSPDGTKLASASEDQTVRVWNVASGQVEQMLNGHTDCVRSVSFSPDGTQIASASHDHSVRVWEAATGQELLQLRGHTGWVSSVSFSPDGQRLVSSSGTWSNPGEIKVWNAARNQESITLTGHANPVTSLSFSPDGKRLVSSSDDDGTVKIWDLSAKRETLSLKAHNQGIRCVVFSPNGTLFASASGDKQVKVWNAVTGQLALTLEGHANGINSVAFSPDGKRLATASYDKSVKVWNAATGEQQLTLNFRGCNEYVRSVAFSPDGQRILTASGDGRGPGFIKVWNVESRREMLNLKGHPGGITCASFSPNGRQITSASQDGTMKVWDASTGLEKLKLKGHSARVSSVVFSPDGMRLASASEDKSLKVWNASTGQEILSLEGHACVAFSPGGTRLASAASNNTIRIWNASSFNDD